MRLSLLLHTTEGSGLRSYSVEPQIWGGAEGGCAHVWGEPQPFVTDHKPTGKQQTQHGTLDRRTELPSSAFCQSCGAWLGHLGLERSPWCNDAMLGQPCTDQCYLSHLLAVCDELFRVLRDDGVLCWNCADSYNSGTQYNHGSPGSKIAYGEWEGTWPGHRPMQKGLKPKNLLNLPARFSIAMQARGWILRSAFDWIKDNSMPESVTDRPSVSTERLFLFAKRGTYYWDAEAIRQPLSTTTHPSGNGFDRGGVRLGHGEGRTTEWTPQQANCRNRRTGDWWKESLDRLITDTAVWLAHAQQVRDTGGLLLSPEGEPLGLHVNPQALKEAHYAAYPEDLVRPFILAGTSERGCCPQPDCQAPWMRVVDNSGGGGNTGCNVGLNKRTYTNLGGGTYVPNHHTLGWRPTCTHYPQTDQWREVPHQQKGEADDAYQARIAPIVQQQAELLALWAPLEASPCTVLDPFLGSGTSAVVSRNLGRKVVGVELSEAYLKLAQKRLRQQVLPFDEPSAPQDSPASVQETFSFGDT